MRNNTFEKASEKWAECEREYERMLDRAQTLADMDAVDTFLYRERHKWQLAVKRAFRHGTSDMSPDQFESWWKNEHGPASYQKQEERIAMRTERIAQIQEKRQRLEISEKLYVKLGEVGVPD